jgi:hypothetical protein
VAAAESADAVSHGATGSHPGGNGS